MDLYALLILFAPLAATAADNAVGAQFGILVPNPCDTFWNIPRNLQQAFLQYKEKNNVHTLDSIDAYRRYTVASIEPEATDTWSWDRRQATPTVTSAYTTADCSTYYPPPTSLRSTELDTVAVTDSMPPPVTTALSSKGTDKNNDVTVQGQRGTKTLTTVTNIALTTLVTSKTETSHTNALIEGEKTTGPSTATTNAATTNILTEGGVTTSLSTALLTATHSIKPAPTGIETYCWPTPVNSTGFNVTDFNVDPNWVHNSIHEACLSLQKEPTLSQTFWFLHAPVYSPDCNLVISIKLQNEKYEPLAIITSYDNFHSTCFENFNLAFESCK